jgi:hypothetical protein
MKYLLIVLYIGSGSTSLVAEFDGPASCRVALADIQKVQRTLRLGRVTAGCYATNVAKPRTIWLDRERKQQLKEGR